MGVRSESRRACPACTDDVTALFNSVEGPSDFLVVAMSMSEDGLEDRR